MKALFHFLGGVHFAIVLIVCTLLFVIAGTFLESFAQSHLFAARWTYHSPSFSFLLALFFVNILFAALRRWPFKKKHVPFLLTHLGLLMVIGGTFVKNNWGTQGQLALTEGCESTHLLLPHSYALQIESRKESALIPLKPGKKGELQSSFPVQITLLDWVAHSEEKLEGWIYEGAVQIAGLPPFQRLKTKEALLLLNEEAEGPSISFFEDKIVAKSVDQRLELPLSKEAIMIFDKGFAGYGYFAELPPGFPAIELISPIRRHVESLKPHKKREDLRPAIRLLFEEGGRSEVVTLSFDPHATKLKWPVLFGQYLVRFCPQEQPLPHTIYLQKAEQVNYPGTTKPLSFESHLVIDGEEHLITMNRVHETKKHFRFYMANLYTPSEQSAARALLVVNRDPGKFFLTYPGGAILALGILLLFLKKRYV